MSDLSLPLPVNNTLLVVKEGVKHATCLKLKGGAPKEEHRHQ